MIYHLSHQSYVLLWKHLTMFLYWSECICPFQIPLKAHKNIRTTRLETNSDLDIRSKYAFFEVISSCASFPLLYLKMQCLYYVHINVASRIKEILGTRIFISLMNTWHLGRGFQLPSDDVSQSSSLSDVSSAFDRLFKPSVMFLWSISRTKIKTYQTSILFFHNWI